MRRSVLPLVVALALVAAASSAAAEADGARVSPAGNATFPERAYRLTLPQDVKLNAVRVRVTENGQEVSDPSVVPAQLAGSGQLAAVLAIDASNSMRGEPIRAAMAAAQVFAGRRNPQQQLAIIAFSDRVRVLLPFTRNPAAIDRALAQAPQLHEGTRVNDAVTRASALLKSAGIGSGSIVLLSDGADLGSASSPAAAWSAARAAHARIYSVGLRSGAFDGEALKALADQTGGRYVQATSTAALQAIFDRLGFELAHEYIVRYRSLAGPKKKVVVRIRVADIAGTATTKYETPALPTAPTEPYQPSPWLRFWQSGAALAAAMIAAMALITFGLFAVLRPNKDRTLRRRLSEFVSVPGAVRSSTRGSLSDAREGVDRVGPPSSLWERFQEELEIADISISAGQIVLWTAVGTVVLGWLLWLAAGPIAALAAVAVPFLVHAYIGRRADRRRQAFVDQLPDNLAVLGAALRAGHSLLGALSVVVDDAGEPTQSEFRRVIAEEQLGIPLEDAMGEVARRMDCRDLDQVALVAALGRDTGGNTAEVLDRVTDTIRERADLRRLVRTLTTQGRMSRWIVSFLPVVLLILITLISPEYIAPLYDKTVGRLLLAFAAVLVVCGSLVIRRIVNIKV